MMADHNEYIRAHYRHVQYQDDAQEGNRNKDANEINKQHENKISYSPFRQA